MKRATLEIHLTLAEPHVREGEIHLTRRREIVAVATELLVSLERTQLLHVAHRDQLSRDLAENVGVLKSESKLVESAARH